MSKEETDAVNKSCTARIWTLRSNISGKSRHYLYLVKEKRMTGDLGDIFTRMLWLYMVGSRIVLKIPILELDGDIQTC